MEYESPSSYDSKVVAKVKSFQKVGQMSRSRSLGSKFWHSWKGLAYKLEPFNVARAEGTNHRNDFGWNLAFGLADPNFWFTKKKRNSAVITKYETVFLVMINKVFLVNSVFRDHEHVSGSSEKKFSVQLDQE